MKKPNRKKAKVNTSNDVDVFIIWLDSAIRRITRQKAKGTIIEYVGTSGFTFNVKGLQFSFRQPAFVEGMEVTQTRSDSDNTFAFKVAKPNELSWDDVMPDLMKKAAESITKARRTCNGGFDEQIHALVSGQIRTYPLRDS